MSNLGIGLIGAGTMGAEHVTALHRSVSGARVSMVADIDRDRAGLVAAAVPGARTTDDAFDLIADPDVQAVVIASPDSTHADLTSAAVRAGKPVMCEKPLAPALDDCVRVVSEEKQAGSGLVSVGFMRRFDPGYVALKAAVANGACGTPLLLYCMHRAMSVPPGTDNEATIGGSAIHEFDIVPWLLDSPIAEVSWRAPRSISATSGCQDPQLILLRTADGALTTVEIFVNARYGYDVRCEIVGERGTLALAPFTRLVTDTARTRSAGYPADWRPRFADAYRLELQAWTDSIVARQPSPLASARDGLVAAAVAEAVITSMRSGGDAVAVKVPEC